MDDKKIALTKEAFIKIRKIEKELSEGKFDNLEYFLKYSGKMALNYALEWASFYGKNDLVKKILSEPTDFNASNGIALTIACKNGHLNIVKFLLVNGADINVANSAPLVEAIENKHSKTVRYLLKYKNSEKERACDIHSEYELPLRTAINSNQYNITKILVDYGANINVLDGYPLIAAIKKDNYDMVKLFLKCGVGKSFLPQAILTAKELKNDNIIDILQNELSKKNSIL